VQKQVPVTISSNLRARPVLHRVFRSRILGPAVAGTLDIIEGIENWRIWHLMGSAELRQRYARSRLGQLWVTLSTGILIGSLGLVWSVLWRTPVAQMMPYIALSMVMWAFISSIIGDSTSVFVKNGRFFLNQRMSFATAVLALMYQHLLVLLHNSLIVILIFTLFEKSVGIQALLAVLGFGLAVVTAFWVSYVVGMACTRYRDLGQVVSSLLQIGFFLTPVLFKSNIIPEEYRHLLSWNPFAIFLSIVRDPILGESVPVNHWLIAISIAFGGLVATLPVIGRFHRRIIYWI
jgi:ABC-type polysaccharide/polyol phosphate export permease